MEKNNGKIVAVIALAIAVVALSVGFAAFSATLNITNTTATISGNDEFSPNVNFVAASKCYYTDDTAKTALANGVEGTALNKAWTGVAVPLTSEHKSVTCEAEIMNSSAYTAYLRKISIASSLNCEAVGTGDSAASSSIVSSICATTKATVKIDSSTATFTNSTNSDVTVSGDNSTIAANNGTKTVYLTIEYTSSFAPDGDMKVNVPTIALLYKTE